MQDLMRSTCLVNVAIVFIRSRIMSFRLVPISVTLNNLELQNGPVTEYHNEHSLHYSTKFVYDVVVKQLLGLPRFQSLLLIVYDHINTICASIHRLFRPNKLL